ncbi:MAG: hypothetical protein U0401_21525 [Anaerolineae bacterium]
MAIRAARPAEQVAEDVRNGYITREAAEREYGVMLDESVIARP